MISIIIVHWNTPAELRKRLSQLSGHKLAEIIVVDNASIEPLSWIKKDFPLVTLVQNKINQGYAFAGNQGAQKAKGEWLLFLNPDVDIEKSALDSLVIAAQTRGFDAASPHPHSNDYQKPLPNWFTLLVEFSPLKSFIPLSFFSPKTLFGGCLLIKKEILSNLGGWDERFFLWFEDSDLTKQLVNENYVIGWVDIPIHHEGGTSFKKLDNQLKKDIFFHSMDIYARKHFSKGGTMIVSFLKKRYSNNQLLPHLSENVSITVPNMKIDLLTDFLKKNEPFLAEIDELIVVSSGLTHKDVWTFRKNYPTVRFIPLKTNDGFASTVNIGFRVSRSRFTGTVNDDVILSKGWLKKMISQTDISVGSINPVIYKSDKSIESIGVTILPIGKAAPNKEWSPKTKVVVVDATNAAAVVYNHEVLNKVGIFDQRFGSYLEDIDLSLRIKKAGFKNVVMTDVGVTHKGQSTSTSLGIRKQIYDFRNWIFVILKNWGLAKIINNFPQILIERLRNISGILKKGKSE